MDQTEFKEKIEETLHRQVVGIGNGAHINIPLKHKGKQVKVLILSGYHPCDECGKPLHNRRDYLCDDCLDNYDETARVSQ